MSVQKIPSILIDSSLTGAAGKVPIGNSSGKLDSSWISVSLPDQTGNSGKYLTTDGTTASWATVNALPSQTNNSGKFLTTNGTTASWVTPDYLPTTGGTITGHIYGRPVVGTSATATGDDLPVMFVSRENTLLRGDTPDKARYFTIGVATDSTGTLDNYHKYGQIQVTLASSGMVSTELVAYRNVAGNNSQSKISINQTVDGTVSTTAPTPPVNSNNTNIATTEWVNTKITSSLSNIDALPSQSGNSGKYLTTDGSSASWATVDSLPLQVGNSGKFLSTNGTTASWETVDALPSQTGNAGKFLATDGSAPAWVEMEIPIQAGNSGKFLTTNGSTMSWSNLNDIRITSVHTPTAGDTTITLTSGQNIPSNVSEYALSIYRNGLYLTPTTDYGFNSSTGVITFVNAFSSNETVNVIFTYISTDGQGMSQGGSGGGNSVEYEAGSGIAFNLNPLTNKTVISADMHPSEGCAINSNASGNISLNIDTTSVYAFIATGNISFSFLKDSTLEIYNTPRSTTLSLLIQNGGDYIISWPSNVYWPKNTAPTLSSNNQCDLINLITFDSGTTWIGSVSTNYTISA